MSCEWINWRNAGKYYCKECEEKKCKFGEKIATAHGGTTKKIGSAGKNKTVFGQRFGRGWKLRRGALHHRAERDGRVPN
jgi:hypothetical protein